MGKSLKLNHLTQYPKGDWANGFDRTREFDSDEEAEYLLKQFSVRKGDNTMEQIDWFDKSNYREIIFPK